MICSTSSCKKVRPWFNQVTVYSTFSYPILSLNYRERYNVFYTHQYPPFECTMLIPSFRLYSLWDCSGAPAVMDALHNTVLIGNSAIHLVSISFQAAWCVNAAQKFMLVQISRLSQNTFENVVLILLIFQAPIKQQWQCRPFMVTAVIASINPMLNRGASIGIECT